MVLQVVTPTFRSIISRCLIGNRYILHTHRPPTVSVLAMSTSSGISSPPESLLKPLEVPHKILMGPGPSNCPPRVLAACALPMLGHLHPEFTKIMDEVKEGLQYVFQTKNTWTFVVSGTGHAAMEAACCNLLEAEEVALSCQNGVWGERFADMVERNGSVAEKLIKPMGEVFTLDDIEEGLKKYKPKILFITHGESSGATVQPLNGIGELCHRYNCLLLVDSVAAMGGVPVYMDTLGIDVLYSGSQKVLSTPPGVSPISFSAAAREKVLSRKTKVQSWYFDAKELANYWGCDENPRRYHHTAPITCIYALREGLARLAEQGLEASWKNSKECSELLWDGVENIGLQLLVPKKEYRNPCVTGIRVPDGINWKDVTDYAMKTYQVEISGGLGMLAGKIWRVGVMGYNATPDNVNLVIKALKEGIENCKK